MIKKQSYVPPCFNAFAYEDKKLTSKTSQPNITEKKEDLSNKNSSASTFVPEAKPVHITEKTCCKTDNNNSICTLIIILLLISAIQKQGA